MLTYFPLEPYHKRPTGRELVNRYPLRRVMQQLRNRNEVLECGHEYWINCYTVPARRRRCKSCWVEEQQLKAALGRHWDGVESVAVFGIALPLRDGWDYAGAAGGDTYERAGDVSDEAYDLLGMPRTMTDPRERNRLQRWEHPLLVLRKRLVVRRHGEPTSAWLRHGIRFNSGEFYPIWEDQKLGGGQHPLFFGGSLERPHHSTDDALAAMLVAEHNESVDGQAR